VVCAQKAGESQACMGRQAKRRPVEVVARQSALESRQTVLSQKVRGVLKHHPAMEGKQPVESPGEVEASPVQKKATKKDKMGNEEWQKCKNMVHSKAGCHRRKKCAM